MGKLDEMTFALVHFSELDSSRSPFSIIFITPDNKNMDKPDLHLEKIAKTEEPPVYPDNERRIMIAETMRLLEKIDETVNLFPFPGLNPGVQEGMEETEKGLAEYADVPGFDMGIPIKDLLAKYKEEGMKIVLGSENDPYCNIFFLPADSLEDTATIKNEGCLSFHQLAIDNIPEKFKYLIKLVRLKTDFHHRQKELHERERSKNKT